MIAYFDCFAGAAGDMILAALIDAGAPIDVVNDAIASLGLDARVSTKVVQRQGLRGLTLQIDAGDQKVSTYHEAEKLLTDAPLAEGVSRRAMKAMTALATAEARLHGVALPDVHFHEISAIDTIVDIVGSAAALGALEVDSIRTSPIAITRGWIESSHGRLPLPAPAAAELLIGVPITEVDINAEIVTPTGAAILTSFSDGHGAMPNMSYSSIGYGAGSRDLSIPNLIRVFIGEPLEQTSTEEQVQIECNIDDMNPELYPFVIERLMDLGALDVWVTPTMAKKGRPGFLLGALVEPHLEDKVRQEIFLQTTTLGLRSFPVRRSALERGFIEVEVAGHRIRVKIAYMDEEAVNVAPEYSDCEKVARATSMSLKEVFRLATIAAGDVGGGRERI